MQLSFNLLTHYDFSRTLLNPTHTQKYFSSQGYLFIYFLCVWCGSCDGKKLIKQRYALVTKGICCWFGTCIFFVYYFGEGSFAIWRGRWTKSIDTKYLYYLIRYVWRNKCCLTTLNTFCFVNDYNKIYFFVCVCVCLCIVD